jgi:hypothetical protein
MDHGKRGDILLDHFPPGIPKARSGRDPQLAPDIQIADLGADIEAEPWELKAETMEYEFGLLIDHTGTAGLIYPPVVFQARLKVPLPDPVS